MSVLKGVIVFQPTCEACGNTDLSVVNWPSPTCCKVKCHCGQVQLVKIEMQQAPGTPGRPRKAESERVKA